MGVETLLTLVAGFALAAPVVSSIETFPHEFRLSGPESRLQLRVDGKGPAGTCFDLTRHEQTVYRSLDPEIVGIEPGGRVRPLKEGGGRVAVRFGPFEQVVRVRVDGLVAPSPVRFTADVLPVLTRLGCNGGSCHGKSSGQNGFRLSLFGSDPPLDYESLALEGRGRRLFPAAPETSLVVAKPTAAVPHGGGKRMAPGSPAYQTLLRWIREGSPGPGPHPDDPETVHLTIDPPAGRLSPGEGQQVRVVLTGAEGSVSDVTHLARYQSNAPELLEVDPSGRLTALPGAGVVGVSAVVSGRVAVARFDVSPSHRQTRPVPSEHFVDRYVDRQLDRLGLVASPPATDGEFARRSSLDLTGTLPSPEEFAAFEADESPSKRVRWVDRLLNRPEYADRFAMEWSAVLRNRRTLGSLSQPGTHAFYDWVRQAVAENRPYHRLVAELLTAKGDPSRNPAVVWYRNAESAEQRTDDVAQLFLGVRLQCARCHDHPGDRWKVDDYQGLAAFFQNLGQKPGDDPASPRVFFQQPEQGSTISPRFLGEGGRVSLRPDEDPRDALAEWFGRPDNPYLARALVNRYWALFFGRGLVEPEDDFRPTNLPSHPELLDALADDFVASGFDLKALVRTIVTSRAYGRSSLPTGSNRSDRRNLSRFQPRRLPAEFLLDAINAVCGAEDDFAGMPLGTRAVQLPDEAVDTPERFLATFGRPRRETVCACERTSEPDLSQRLLLLNSPEIEAKIRHPVGRAATLADDPRRDTEKVRELYRTAFSRNPRPAEVAAALDHLNRCRSNVRRGYEDLIWSVINTLEFQFVY